jgi:proteasome accessory factor B
MPGQRHHQPTGASKTTVERAERLLDLVALFLNAHEPISWAEIQEVFPEIYAQGSVEANIRKFERDKADLLEVGFALTYLQGEEREKDGYVLDRGGYYLPELALQPDELAVLYAAGSAALAEEAFPFRDDLAHALKKMAFAAGDDADAGRDWARLGGGSERPAAGEGGDGGGTLAQHVSLLSRAIAGRKRVNLRYRSLQRGQVLDREVDPYGLVYRFGAWSFAGYCHLRKGPRVFRVDRIQRLEMNESKPRSPDFEVPADFRIEDVAGARPWEFGRHGSGTFEARLRLSPDLAFLAGRTFTGAQVVERSKRGVVLSLRVSDGDALLRAVLPLGEGAEIIGPPELRARARAVLEDLLSRHADRPGDEAELEVVTGGRKRREA